MRARKFIEFQKQVGLGIRCFVGNSEASQLLGGILQSMPGDAENHRQILQSAIQSSRLTEVEEHTVKSFKSGSASRTYYLEFYFYLHRHHPKIEDLAQVDQLVFDGQTYAQKFGHSVNGDKIPNANKIPDRLEVVADRLDETSQRLTQNSQSEVPPHSKPSGNYWKIAPGTLRGFFEPIVPKDHVDSLIHATHDVINDQIAQSPKKFKSSISERAAELGIIQGDTYQTVDLAANITTQIYKERTP